MNQTLKKLRQVIEGHFVKQGVEYSYIAENDGDDNQPILAYRTEFGFGMFSDRNVEEPTFFVLVKEADEEEDVIYAEVTLDAFVKILTGLLGIEELNIIF